MSALVLFVDDIEFLGGGVSDMEEPLIYQQDIERWEDISWLNGICDFHTDFFDAFGDCDIIYTFSWVRLQNNI